MKGEPVDSAPLVGAQLRPESLGQGGSRKRLEALHQDTQSLEPGWRGGFAALAHRREVRQQTGRNPTTLETLAQQVRHPVTEAIEPVRWERCEAAPFERDQCLATVPGADHTLGGQPSRGRLPSLGLDLEAKLEAVSARVQAGDQRSRPIEASMSVPLDLPTEALQLLCESQGVFALCHEAVSRDQPQTLAEMAEQSLLSRTVAQRYVSAEMDEATGVDPRTGWAPVDERRERDESIAVALRPHHEAWCLARRAG
jgi:hypothetical protein